MTVRTISFLPVALVAGFVLSADAAPPSAWVYYGADGTLQYQATAMGDKILDYSPVGYMRGAQNIPFVPVVLTLNPTGTSADDTARIQVAIDQVSAMPLQPNGFRGAIEFTAGTYNIANTSDPLAHAQIGLKVNASGVVLRGQGQGTNGTIFLATGTTSYNVLTVNPGTGVLMGFLEESGSAQPISDLYVPVGATSFSVPDASIYQVGDQIVVNRPMTQKWIDDIKMGSAAPPNGLADEHFVPNPNHIQADRTITAINGNTITINSGITTAIDSRTIDGITNAYGGGTIFKYKSARIQNIGIENLRFDTVFASPTDENHAGRPIVYAGVVNGWVRSITTIHYFNGPIIDAKCEYVTLQDTLFRDPVGGTTTGGDALVGQYSLFQRNTTFNARAPFVTQASNTVGPDVFVFGTAIGSLQSVGPHQRWASGVLWDNIKVTSNPSRGGGIELVNRGNFGTGHGWAGANMVTWNTKSPWIDVESPPTAQNWAIGAVSPDRRVDFTGPEGIYDSFDTRVAPNSLYIAQLKQALGPQPAPRVVVRTVTVGDMDDFVNSGASDVPFVDPDWKVIAQNDLPNTTDNTILGFDSAATNAKRAATIKYLLNPGEIVVAGSLTMRLKALATITESDSFFLNSAGMELDYDMLDLFSSASPWTAGTVKTVVIDLTEIYGPLLGPLQNDQLGTGQFNLFWGGNMDVDYVRLSLRIVPDPSSLRLALAIGALLAAIAVLSVGVWYIILRRRRRLRNPSG